MEMMIETNQSIDRDSEQGESIYLCMLQPAHGRCTAAHFGTHASHAS